MSDGGKGSKPRPFSNYEHYETNWDKIFKHNKELTNKEKENERAKELQHSGTKRS